MNFGDHTNHNITFDFFGVINLKVRKNKCQIENGKAEYMNGECGHLKYE